MDKKSKEALRRYKKSRQAASSSDSSSSSESDTGTSGSSYSSSDSDRRHRKKKSSSSSGDERRKREKREKCQKKLEAKRQDLKRKLKLKKKAAAAAAALSGHSHHALSPSTQAKIKKLAERKHRERLKHRSERERHQAGSRSPSVSTKIRIHQDVKRQKSPQRVHHQLMSREKIIIQTRTRDRTPSLERERLRHEHKIRHHDEYARDRDRRERDKERAEALARCQERQRERERLAREKIRREEEEKKYGRSLATSDAGERLLPRPAEREMAIATARGYSSRERSLEAVERTRHVSKRELDVYEREREYLEAERRGLLDRDELRREREYLAVRRRDLSPVMEHYAARMRDPRDMYSEDERERAYGRTYIDDVRHNRERENWLDMREREIHELHDTRDFRELDHDMLYPDERELIVRERERNATRNDWKNEWDASRERTWEDPARNVFQKRSNPIPIASNAGPNKIPRDQRIPSEPDWDVNEINSKLEGKTEKSNFGNNAGQRDNWSEHDQRDKPLPPGRTEPMDRRWPAEWRDGEESLSRVAHNAQGLMLHHRSERGRGFRRGGLMDHGERIPLGSGYRPHPPPLMTLPVQPPGGYHGNPRFPNKRSMTYTNPNLIKKQQAALVAAKAAAQASAVAAATTAVAAAKAAAQSAANAVTNPGILGQVSGVRSQTCATEDDKPEAGEIVAENENENEMSSKDNDEKLTDEKPVETLANDVTNEEKGNGELSEISDSEDDILNKAEKKSKIEVESDGVVKQALQTDVLTEQKPLHSEDTAHSDERADDEEMLDFEEISDGELEEDARNKGVGDALGVDWASLIAETKRQAANTTPTASEQHTTAKQKWQPHRIILDVGISMRMAGEDYARRLLNESKQKLLDELGQFSIKSEIKDEICTGDDDSQITMDTDENSTETINRKSQQKSLEELNDSTLNVDCMHPLAYIQVGERLNYKERSKLFANLCGANSRALSARQDLKIRRQLCGLPARECDIPRTLPTVSDKLKQLAVAAYQRTLEVK